MEDEISISISDNSRFKVEGRRIELDCIQKIKYSHCLQRKKYGSLG